METPKNQQLNSGTSALFRPARDPFPAEFLQALIESGFDAVADALNPDDGPLTENGMLTVRDLLDQTRALSYMATSKHKPENWRSDLVAQVQEVLWALRAYDVDWYTCAGEIIHSDIDALAPDGRPWIVQLS